jgi:hypothetical protein
MTLRCSKVGLLTLALAAVGCTGSLTGSGPDDTNNNGTGSTPGAVGGSSNIPGGGSNNSTGGVPDNVPPDTPSRLKLEGNPAYYRVLRLTNAQWTNSVQNVLALSSPPTNAEGFQNAVSGMTDFANNELALLEIDNRGWSDYQGAAEALAKQVSSDPAQLSKIYSGTDGAGFIAKVGRRVYRRPLTTGEVASYQKLFDMGPSLSGSGTSFAKGAGLVLEAMLQSPYFIYRTELGAANTPLSGYEMAAKLSLWLRNTTPDDALLDAAAGPGKLDTAEGAAAMAETMLDEPAAKAVMRSFHGEFLKFAKFQNLAKDAGPGFDPATTPAELVESSYLFFDKIFSEGLGVKDIFLSTKGFVGPTMAAAYGVSAPASGFVERDMDANRIGYFLQLPFLMLNSRPDGPDPIHRGVSMSLDVLCAPLGQFGGTLPPLPPRKAGETNRVRVDNHTMGCGAECHNQMINPMGFAFEHFDGMGKYRDMEVNGTESLPIDSSGSFSFVDGTKSYSDATELMKLLATEKQTHLCYAKKLASFGLQRDVVQSDLEMLGNMANVSESNGGSIKQVLIDLVKEDAFRVRSGGAK